jgi:hypothetical protein
MDRILIAAFALLQIADGLITYIGMRCSDIDEANPVASFCFEHFGLGTSIATLKVLGLAFLAVLFLRRHRVRCGWVTATWTIVVSAYVWVVAQNLALVLAA